jgi:hypothetical protein
MRQSCGNRDPLGPHDLPNLLKPSTITIPHAQTDPAPANKQITASPTRGSERKQEEHLGTFGIEFAEYGPSRLSFHLRTSDPSRDMFGPSFLLAWSLLFCVELNEAHHPVTRNQVR